MSRTDRPRRRPRPAWLSLLLVWLPGVLLVAAGFAVAISFIEPAPPEVVRIATGSPTGAYTRAAEAWRPVFARADITLEVVHTAGTVDNLARLQAGEVDAAIVQGGVPAADPEALQGIAALYHEPIMVFHRGDAPGEELEVLAGRRVAVGAEGSGTRIAALELLGATGLAERVETVPMGSEAATEALLRGEIDGAFLVTAPTQPEVARLLAAPGVQLLRMRRALAFSRRLPHLVTVTLPRGSVDLEADLPATDVPLLAATAALVARDAMHDALPPLFVAAAKRVHGQGSLLAPPNMFPALEPLDFEVEAETRQAFEDGHSFLYRVLPFWAASLVDRLKILLLPLLTLLIPLFRVAPPLYRWRIRSRIYRWYKALRALDAEALYGRVTLAEARARIRQLRVEIAEVDVPVSYMDELYHLRLHAELVQRRLEDRLDPDADEPGADPPPAAHGATPDAHAAPPDDADGPDEPPPAPPPPPGDTPPPPPVDDAPAPPADTPPPPAEAAPDRAPALPPTAGARRIVRRHALAAAGLGLVPIPAVDVATTAAVALTMLRRLAAYYGTPFTPDRGKAAIAALLGGAATGGAALGGAALAKAVPGVGTGLGVIAGPAAAASTTLALGRVFAAHFGAGGTLFDFDPEVYRAWSTSIAPGATTTRG